MAGSFLRGRAIREDSESATWGHLEPLQVAVPLEVAVPLGVAPSGAKWLQVAPSGSKWQSHLKCLEIWLGSHYV